MESKVKLFGHALHPILIPFPLGLLVTSIVFDFVYLLTGNGKWSEIAFWLIAAGVFGGLVAAVPGLIDWLALPSGTRAKAVGLWHGGGNVVAIALFIASWLLRADEPGESEAIPIIFSVLGVVLSGVTGWLGGELVERLGVGVDEGAHLKSPNSLSRRPASEGSTGTRREK